MIEKGVLLDERRPRLPLATQPFVRMCSCMQGDHMFLVWWDNYLGLLVFQVAMYN